MKIRTGFVSNSSSTAFIFVTKSKDINNLVKLIRKHDLFNLVYDYHNFFEDTEEMIHIRTEDVIDAIEQNYVKKDDDYDAVKFRHITDLIKEKESWQKEVELRMEEANKSMLKSVIDRYSADELIQGVNEIHDLKSFIKKGFKYYLEIGFGDNHGHVCGYPLGVAMDYEGRLVSLRDKNLILYTEQRR